MKLPTLVHRAQQADDITPILKKADLNVANVRSYRPISNFSVLSKLLERLVGSQLLQYLKDNGLLPDLQSAYRAHHSKETAQGPKWHTAGSGLGQLSNADTCSTCQLHSTVSTTTRSCSGWRRRTLGVYIDADVSIRTHVTNTVRACFASFRQLRSVRRSLPGQALLTLVRALLVSKVDYCISVLAGISGSLQNRLESALNAAAGLVCSARKSEHITPLLQPLVACSRAHPVPVMCAGLPLCARHSASLPCWQSPADCRRLCTSSSALYRHDDAASAVDATLYHRGPGISSGSSSSLGQSITCDESRQLAALVSARDKSASFSPVVSGLTRTCYRQS